MSNGRRVKKGGFPWKGLLLALVALVALIVIGVAFLFGRGGETAPSEEGGSALTQPEDTGEGDTPEEGETPSEEAQQPEEQPSAQESEDPTEPQEPTGEETGAETPTETVEEEAPSQPMEVIQRADGTYEQWLAAGAVVAVSMQYPDFSLDGIYLTGETPLEDKQESNGVYVLFTAGDGQQAVHAAPLEEERTQAGTVDLYTMDLGFASFEVTDAAGVDTSALQEVALEDLEEMISQSLLVSLYEH